MKMYVSQPAAPLYDMGWSLPPVARRSTQTVRQPAYPLYEAGAFDHGLSGWGLGSGATILATTAPIAAVATTAMIASMEAGTAMASWAGPIGAAVGALIGIIAGLWAAHDARVAGAKAENQAINSAVQTWDAGMKAIFAAVNSSDLTTNVSASVAAQQVQELYQTFWSKMAPYMHAPGTSDTSGGGVNCGSSQLNPAGPCQGTPQGHMCDKSCTATCCVGCQDLYPSMLQALAVLNSPTGGSVQVCAVAGSKYGANARGGYTLTYSPPSVSSVASGLTSDLSSLFGGGSSSSSMLPLLAIGAAAFFLLR